MKNILRYFRIRTKKTNNAAFGAEIRPFDGQGPYTTYFNKYVPRKVDANLYEAMREAIPVIDAAINRLVSLDGHIIVTGNNESLVQEIQEFTYNIAVNDIQKGLHAFHQGITNEALEQGFSIGEFITNKKRTDIIHLKIADSKTIKFRRSNKPGLNPLEILQKADSDLDYRLLKPDNLLYFSINNENQNPYGTSIMRSMEFVTKILATIHNALLHNWERWGDPSFHVDYRTSKRSFGDNTLEDRRKKISTDFTTAIGKKREGQSMDFVTAIDKDSEMSIKVIGADGQILELEAPARHILEQIISKTGLPSWMLGMRWSTTAGLADKEVTMLLADVATRQAAKMPLFYNLIKTLLILRGRTWKKGDWKLEWKQLNLYDIEKLARARFLNAQADLMTQNSLEEKNIKSQKSQKILNIETSCNCDYHKQVEQNRPIDWRELDKLEDEYEEVLKSNWHDLENQVLTILKLPIKSLINYKQDIPDIDIFTFTDEQRAQIFTAMNNKIGIYDINDENSPVRWYYGQAYSEGLIQAVHLIGKEQPILNIIKNKEIYDDLCKEGFKLVKKITEKSIQNKIMIEMETQMLAGTNPIHVADVLKKKFEDVDMDWERLARTEMTSAAERAKKDEWIAWEIKEQGFSAAPDACPFCKSLVKEYKIKKCPIPGTDTHPRCRCSTYPVVN